MSISGPKAETDAFFRRIDHHNAAILQTFIPMPEVLNGTESPMPESPEPHPNWAVLLANGDITQEWHDELVQTRIDRYNKGQEALAACGYSNWWDWQTKNWGVKWGDSETNVTRYLDGTISITYQTPWGPPTEGIITISKQFPNCSFTITYKEEGMCILGAARIENGEIVAESDADSSEWPDWSEDDDGTSYTETLDDMMSVCISEVDA